MRQRFSLATLMLLVAIAALGLASLRTAIGTALTLDQSSQAATSFPNQGPQNPQAIYQTILAIWIVGGSCLGLLLALTLAAWNTRSLVWTIASCAGGVFLGGAAGAQCLVKVDWPVIFLAPVVLVGGTLLVAVNERRRRTARKGESESWQFLG